MGPQRQKVKQWSEDLPVLVLEKRPFLPEATCHSTPHWGIFFFFFKNLDEYLDSPGLTVVTFST